MAAVHFSTIFSLIFSGAHTHMHSHTYIHKNKASINNGELTDDLEIKRGKSHCAIFNILPTCLPPPPSLSLFPFSFFYITNYCILLKSSYPLEPDHNSLHALRLMSTMQEAYQTYLSKSETFATKDYITQAKGAQLLQIIIINNNNILHLLNQPHLWPATVPSIL